MTRKQKYPLWGLGDTEAKRRGTCEANEEEVMHVAEE
jgi:hypothetical protein